MTQTLGLALVVLCFAFVKSDNPIVTTHYGQVRGFQYDLGREDNKTADIFLNIPYAKPPIGNLRFEKPRKPNSWTGIRDALEFGLACAPNGFPSNNISSNSEDCLYLNVFRPSGNNPASPTGGYPVVIWIHGGSLATGSTKAFDYQGFAKNFIPQGIIVVSIQYRLGPFGYATTGDSVLPGNLGHWDMTESVKFVRKTIGQFGGNKNKITLWGLSASSIAISALALSPKSRDLFQQSIQQSGSAFSQFFSGEVVGSTLEIATQLGCPTATSHQIKHCLKNKTLAEYFVALNTTSLTRTTHVNCDKYEPIVDGDFFPDNVRELIKTAPSKPTLMGVGDAEAARYTTFGAVSSRLTPFVIRKNWTLFNETDFEFFVRTGVADVAFYGPEAVNAQEDIIEFYTANKPVNPDYKYWIQQYTQLISDVIFDIPLLWEGEAKASLNWTANYNYLNEHYSEYLYDLIAGPDAPVKGSFHTNEYPYEFGIFGVAAFPFDANELTMQQVLDQSIGNFIKTGNPSSSFLTWPTLTGSQPNNYASLKPSPSFNNGPLWQDRNAFWKSISNGTYPFNIIYRTRDA